MLQGKGTSTRGDVRGRELYYITHLKDASPLVLLRMCIPNSLKNSGKMKILSGKKKDFFGSDFPGSKITTFIGLSYFLGHDDEML